MNIETKTGVVVLLDALGTRTASVEQAKLYLDCLETLQRDVQGTLNVYLKGQPKETLAFYNQLQLHFFGDTILITYEVIKKDEFLKYVQYIFVVLAYFYIAALDGGILLRGAISIGEFIKQQNVVLGPAVADCAAWYDQFEFIGAAATPFSTQYIQHLYCESHGNSNDPWAIDATEMILHDVPTKNGRLSLFAVNRPAYLAYRTIPKPCDFLKEYFLLMHKYAVPIGTEEKFRNTEAFVRAGSAEQKHLFDSKAT